MRVVVHRIILFVMCSSWYMVAVDIGSDTAVTRFNTQQLVEDGDRIAGFAALNAGFSLGGTGVTGTFDSFFPVSGTVDLSFGTLLLNKDLIMQNVSGIDHWGNVVGNNHIIELSGHDHCIPERSGIDLCTITFTHDHIEGASVRSVHVSYDNVYVVYAEGTSIAVDLVVNENYLQDAGSQSVGKTVNTVHWHPSADYIAVGTTSGAGAELFIYSYNRITQVFTLTDSKDFGVAGNSINSVSWHPDGDHLAVASDSNTQTIVVYAFSAGTLGASTTVAITTDCNVVDWNRDGTYLATGFDVSGGFNELRIYAFTKSPLTLTLNASTDTGFNVGTLSWNKAISANGELVVGTDSSAQRLRVYRHNGVAGTIVALDSSGAPAATAVNSVAWHPDGGCIVAGLQNNAEGTGGELRQYSFENDAITQVDDQELGDNVLSVAWSPNGRWLVVGDAGLGSAQPSIGLYRFDSAFVDTSVVTMSGVNWVLNSNVTLDFTSIQFAGESSIKGRGHLLSFSPSFTLVIGSNASVLFHDVVLTGVNGTKLRLTDTTSTVSFQRVRMAIDEDFLFMTGAFEVLDEFIITGDHKFIYQSPCTSTILSRLPEAGGGSCQSGFSGSLIMDTNTTFSYDTTLSSTLIHLEDEYAKFIMRSATLAVTSSMQLTKGRMFFDGKCKILGGDGLIFGDGMLANNLYVELLPAARVDIESGFLVDMNM